MSILKSFFIPRIPFELTKEELRTYFIKCGEVCRIDFVSFNNNSGVGRRAYVHFSQYNETADLAAFLDTRINQDGHIDICLHGNTGNSYLRIMINKNPIPQTVLNLDQVANNTIFIGDQLKEQADIIQRQSNMLEAQAEMINLLKRRIDQLELVWISNQNYDINNYNVQVTST
jgi:RNA recognition motif-containing protein